MKKILKNKKGFTLIELLAVIVILAILVMVAIPAVTRYLNSARQGTFADNALAAISAVRNDMITKGYSEHTYPITEINDLLEKKLNTSSFGGENGAYVGLDGQPMCYITGESGSTEYCGSQIKVTQHETAAGSGEYYFTYEMCLFDKGGRGFYLTEEGEIEANDVKMGGIYTCKSGQTKVNG